jgi:hypothetical protein
MDSVKGPEDKVAAGTHPPRPNTDQKDTRYYFSLFSMRYTEAGLSCHCIALGGRIRLCRKLIGYSENYLIQGQLKE